MTEVLTTMLVWPLPWVLLTLFFGRVFPKAGPAGYFGAMLGAVMLSTLTFGAPSTEGILSAILLWPALGAIVALFLPRQWSNGIRRFSSVWLWAGFVLSLYLLGPVVREALAPTEAELAAHSPLVRILWGHVLAPFFGQFGADPSFSFATAGYRFTEDFAWIESFGIHYKLGVDGISLWLIILTTLLTPLALDVSWNSVNTKVKEFAFSFLLLQVGMIGAFVALDLFLFYVFWELMLVPMYLIIGVWGGKDRVYAAVKFFLYTFVGSPADARRDSLHRDDSTRTLTPAEPHHVRSRKAQRCSMLPAVPSSIVLFFGVCGGLRDQDSDVPVPHVASGRSRPGTRPAAPSSSLRCC